MTENTDPVMLFYCKDCQSALLDAKKLGSKYVYACPVCKGEKVAFGTKNAICDFFHIKEVALKRMLDKTTES